MPNSATAYNNRGDIYRQKKLFQLALSDTYNAIQLDPQQPIYYASMGDIYYDMKNPKNALTFYQKFMELVGGKIPDPSLNYVQERIQELEASLTTPSMPPNSSA